MMYSPFAAVAMMLQLQCILSGESGSLAAQTLRHTPSVREQRLPRSSRIQSAQVQTRVNGMDLNPRFMTVLARSGTSS